MGLKDKLEIGLKPDAPYRPDNLPDFQQDDPSCREAGEPGESRRLRDARDECDEPVTKPRRSNRPVATAAKTPKAATAAKANGTAELRRVKPASPRRRRA